MEQKKETNQIIEQLHCPKCGTEIFTVDNIYGFYRCKRCAYAFDFVPDKPPKIVNKTYGAIGTCGYFPEVKWKE